MIDKVVGHFIVPFEAYTLDEKVILECIKHCFIDWMVDYHTSAYSTVEELMSRKPHLKIKWETAFLQRRGKDVEHAHVYIVEELT